MKRSTFTVEKLWSRDDEGNAVEMGWYGVLEDGCTLVQTKSKNVAMRVAHALMYVGRCTPSWDELRRVVEVNEEQPPKQEPIAW